MLGDILQALLGNSVDYLLDRRGERGSQLRDPQPQSSLVHLLEPAGQLPEGRYEAEPFQRFRAEGGYDSPQLLHRSLGDLAGLAQTAGEPLVLAAGRFAVNEQPEPILAAEFAGVGSVLRPWR